MDNLFKVHEATLMCLKKRREIVDNYDLVKDYEDAVWQVAYFLNSHLRFSVSVQDELPKLLVLAWHYANKEFDCPLTPSEYESFVEALRVDVFKALMLWTRGFVGVKKWYGKKSKKVKG